MLLKRAVLLVVILHGAISLDVSMYHGPTEPRTMSLVLDDEFNTFNLSLWKHELTLSGGGNWEFELYTNNRSNSYVKNGVLYIRPTLLEDDIGLDNLKNGFQMDI